MTTHSVNFIDRVHLSVKSGKGGQGCISFRREKFVPKGGPDGGTGGNGGDVVIRTCQQIQSLSDFKSASQVYRAKSGQPGRPKKMSGAKGQDCIILVPIGTMVYDHSKNLLADLDYDGASIVIAAGGLGGRGNSSFASSRNKAPRHAQEGVEGEEKNLVLELRLIAEVGIIGLPNAGKSTLLKTLTYSNPKVDAYPFTTLSPNLGTLCFLDKHIVLADVPGLIKGASNGLGLGLEFLRHIDRTRVLIHMIAASENPDQSWDDYTVILNELQESPYALLEKPHLLVLSKCDTASEEACSKTLSLFKNKGLSLFCMSSFSKKGIEELKKKIYDLTSD